MTIEELKKWMLEVQDIREVGEATKEAAKKMLSYITLLENDIVYKNNMIEKLLGGTKC